MIYLKARRLVFNEVILLNNEVLYEETDSSQIEKADRVNRYLRGTILLIIEVITIGFLIRYFGLFILPLYIIFTWRYFTRPIPIAPKAYKITKQGVIFGENNIIRLNKVSKITHNRDKKYVSLNRNLRFEMIRLYTNNPLDLYNIIKINLKQES